MMLPLIFAISPHVVYLDNNIARLHSHISAVHGMGKLFIHWIDVVLIVCFFICQSLFKHSLIFSNNCWPWLEYWFVDKHLSAFPCHLYYPAKPKGNIWLLVKKQILIFTLQSGVSVVFEKATSSDVIGAVVWCEYIDWKKGLLSPSINSEVHSPNLFIHTFLCGIIGQFNVNRSKLLYILAQPSELWGV